MAIGALNRAKEATSVTPAKAAFTSAGVLPTSDYDRTPMRTLGDFLTKLSNRIVGEIQRHIIKRGKRNAISRRHWHAKDDEEAVVTWRLDLDRILYIFNTELRMNERVADSATHPGVGDTSTPLVPMFAMILQMLRPSSPTSAMGF